MSWTKEALLASQRRIVKICKDCGTPYQVRVTTRDRQQRRLERATAGSARHRSEMVTDNDYVVEIDPDESWARGSHLLYTEIRHLASLGYLANGTTFRKVGEYQRIRVEMDERGKCRIVRVG